ncbi:hypothetical protein MTO96_039356 [Rhipicephalus appendiculatus]
MPVLVRVIEEQVVAQRQTGTHKETGYILAMFMLMAIGSLVTYVVVTSTGVLISVTRSKTSSYVGSTASKSAHGALSARVSTRRRHLARDFTRQESEEFQRRGRL